MDLRAAQRLFPATLALHVMEEAPGFSQWARRHASPAYTQADFLRINTVGLVSTAALTRAVAGRRSRLAFVAWWSLVLTQQALFNPVFHVGTTVAWRERSPGVVTSVLLFLPLWAAITARALRDGLLTRRTAFAGAAAGGALHAAAVRQQVFRAGR